MTVTINISELASGLADDMQLTDTDLRDLKAGHIPARWSDTLLDRLEYDYSVETLVKNELIKEI